MGAPQQAFAGFVLPSASGGSGSPWVDGGNSFGANGTIGTLDAFDVVVFRNGVEVARFNATGMLLPKTAAGAGSASYEAAFQCVNASGTRQPFIRSVPLGGAGDTTYALAVFGDDSRQLLAINDDAALYGGSPVQTLYVGTGSSADPGNLFLSGQLYTAGARKSAATVVNPGSTLDMSVMTALELLTVSERIAGKPGNSIGTGCTVNLPSAALGLRYEIYDSTGNAGTEGINIVNLVGQTINGVDYSAGGFQVSTAFGVTILQGDEVNGTNWTIIQHI